MKKNKKNRSNTIKATRAVVPETPYYSGYKTAITIAFAMLAVYLLSRYISLNKLSVDALVAAIPGYFRPVFQAVPIPGSLLLNSGHALFAAGITACIVFAAYGYGRLACRYVCTVSLETRLERWFVALGLGTFMFVMICFVLGCLQWLTTATITGACLAGIASMFIPDSRQVNILRPPAQVQHIPFLLKLSLGMCLISEAIVLAAALTPELFYDSLVYHLAGANWYRISGGLEPPVSKTLHFFVSGYGRILYAAGLFFADETYAKLLHLSYVLSAAGLVYMAGTLLYGYRVGIYAVIAFVAMPSTSIVSSRTGMEGFIIFTEFLSLYLAIRYLRSGGRQWLIPSGIVLGTAIGFKYISFMSWAGIGCALLVHAIVSKQPLKKIISDALWWNGCVVLASAPWFVYNMYHTGNPVYPAYWQQLGFLKTKNFAGELYARSNIKELLMAPWTISMGLKEEAFPGIVYLLAAPLFFFTRWLKTDLKYILIYVVVYAIVWVNLGDLYFRYYLPATPALCLLVGFALSEFDTGIVRAVVFVIVVVNTGFSALMLKSIYYPIDYLRGSISRDAYCSTNWQGYPNPPYPAFTWINQNLPANARILLQGEERAYPLMRRYVPMTIGDVNYLDTVLKAAHTTDEVASRLRAEGISHILLNVPEARRLKEYDIFHFAPREHALLVSFWEKYLFEVYRCVPDLALIQQGIFSLKAQRPDMWAQYAADAERYIYVYELLSDEKACHPHAIPRNFFKEQFLFTAARWTELHTDSLP